MIEKCIKCGKQPKKTSYHTYKESNYKIFCECGNQIISHKSMQTTAREWNKINKKT